MDLLKSWILKILELMNFPLYHPDLVLILLCFDELANKVIINLRMHWQRNTELAAWGLMQRWQMLSLEDAYKWSFYNKGLINHWSIRPSVCELNGEWTNQNKFFIKGETHSYVFGKYFLKAILTILFLEKANANLLIFSPDEEMWKLIFDPGHAVPWKLLEKLWFRVEDNE